MTLTFGDELRVFKGRGSDGHRGTLGRPAWMYDWATPEGFTAPHALEVLSPNPAFSANHRVNRQYTGLDYVIRVACRGGAYPYLYELISGVPAGMTINAFTGEITWINPTSNATPTVRVTDVLGSTTTRTWTITVGTSGHKFVDAVNGSDSNAGTLASPWQTLQEVYDSAAGTDIIWFSTGTYTTTGIPTQATDNPSGDEYIDWDAGGQRAKIWLARPGDTMPVIDLGYTGDGCGWTGTGDPSYGCGQSVPALRMNGVVYMDRLKFYRSMTKTFHMFLDVNLLGATWRRCVFDTIGPGIDGGNSSFIDFTAAGGAHALYVIVQDNEFANIIQGSANSGQKLYTLRKCLFENNYYHDFQDGTESLAIKAGIVDYTVRGNRFRSSIYKGIVGNMDVYDGDGVDNCTGEICFNDVRSIVSVTQASGAFDFNIHGTGGQTWAYRNTFQGGHVTAYNVATANGPYRLHSNVISNEDDGTPSGSHVEHETVTDASRIVLTNNLAGFAADELIDGNNLLQGAARTAHRYRRGHEVPA